MDNIIKINIDNNQKTIAEKKYNKLSKEVKKTGYNKRSYRSGKFLLHSILSEIVVKDMLGSKAKIKNAYDYDIIYNFDKIDIKLKPNSDKDPKPYWNASIPAYQLKKQRCDGYIFTRLNRDLTILWITGILSKQDFESKAKFAKTGSLDGRWKWDIDSYYIKIEDLEPLSVYKDGKYVFC
jgi:hypothetical protein